MTIETIPFSWVVKETHTEERMGATVEYTPEDTDTYSVIELFVPVPFQKARDKAHALEILERKVNARAPHNRWIKETIADESGDTETIADEVREEYGLETKAEASEDV